jgi:hypothetical protein
MKTRYKYTVIFEGVDLKTFDTLKAARAYQPPAGGAAPVMYAGRDMAAGYQTN